MIFCSIALQKSDQLSINSHICDLLGHGILHAKNVPKFKGLDRFKGKAVHTAEWDNKFDVRNKKIGVIGTGASAVQVRVIHITKAYTHLDVESGAFLPCFFLRVLSISVI